PYSSLMRETILLRYSLVPYIYSEDWKMHRTGVSLLHPMYCDYPEQEEAYRMDRQYMFGDSLLVSPVISPGDAETGLAEKKTWLPAGKWFDTIQGRLMNGETVLTEKYLLNEIPVFAKAGAIIPSQSGVHNLNGKCYKNLGCTIYPGESGEYLLYEDDGISTGYLSGKFALIRFSHRRTESERVVEIKLDSGTFEGFEEKRSFEIRLPGVIPPSGVQLENAEIQKCKYPDEHAGEPFWSYNGDRAEILISLPEISLICGAEIRVRYAERDEYSKAAGLTGILARMKEIAFLQDLLNLRGTPYGNGRLGRELAAAGRRISLAPENFENEMANFRMKFPILRKVLEDVVREKPETPAGIRCAATIGKALKLYEEILKFL
ncbi:MAG: DUF5110 domain-containing protein, partial [Lentisphaeria bacterium]|nr:DUF5110 domain-containing protein [Lentisphaeria bacterium]